MNTPIGSIRVSHPVWMAFLRLVGSWGDSLQRNRMQNLLTTIMEDEDFYFDVTATLLPGEVPYLTDWSRLNESTRKDIYDLLFCPYHERTRKDVVDDLTRLQYSAELGTKQGRIVDYVIALLVDYVLLAQHHLNNLPSTIPDYEDWCAYTKDDLGRYHETLHHQMAEKRQQAIERHSYVKRLMSRHYQEDTDDKTEKE